jgi:hypothetical protein
MQIDFNDEQSEHETAPISVRGEFGSNSMFSREVHEPKQDTRKMSTDAGMQIDLSEQDEEIVFGPISTSFNPGSKVS